jgi:hypothetical protein
MPKRIRSRIHQYLNGKVLDELNKICRNSVVSDNNEKVSFMLDVLNRNNIEYDELGPGTNRLAILIDNYVFKIALDRWGLQDNLNEFTVSQELQPFVVKTYEVNDNGLISVCEYITVISREEFENNFEPIRSILGTISESYVIGDVGTIPKNFTNWGYRDNGELVILDFAYIYRVDGNEILCSIDQTILEYDKNFHSMLCPKCKRKYSFMDVRRKIPMEIEKRENELAKQLAYKTTTSLIEVRDSEEDGYQDEADKTSADSSYTSNTNPNDFKEDNNMSKNDFYKEEQYVDEEEREDAYLAALRAMGGKTEEIEEQEAVEEMLQDVAEELKEAQEGDKRVSTNYVEVHREDEHESTDIRIIKRTIEKDGVEVNQREQDVADALETLDEVNEDLVAIQDSVPSAEVIQQTLQSPESEATVTIEEGQFVGPVNDEVVKEITDEIETEVVGHPLDQQEETTPDYSNVMVGIETGDSEDNEEESEDQTQEVVVVEKRDVDGDGQDEIVIDRKEVELVDGENSDEDEYDPYEQIMIAQHTLKVQSQEGQQFPTEEVVYSDEVKVTDDITIENEVKVKYNPSSEEDADELRRQLAGDLDNGQDDDMDIDEDRIKRLAKEYEHLDEEAAADEQDFYANKYKKKSWN